MLPLLGLVLISLVIGLQVAMGYVAAPILFMHLDRVLAGQLAGQMLHWAELAGFIVIMAVALLPQRFWLRGVLLLAAGAQLAQLAWLNPTMAALKAGGLTQPALQAQFMHWHGVSQVVYVAGWGLLCVWIGLRLRQLSTDK
ncbi:MAG TPA: DUF4149 domain-containing protein [Piscirickettsiaceae bacterium]|nr:DUF4149 domain-containing protein [Piscirickettsiaceae bacterium]HIQ40107.1 DUF4149 domain-containing protein [Sulfurivirga caldicuralii]